MKIAWKIKGFQRDETHRKCTQNHSGAQDRGKLEISLWYCHTWVRIPPAPPTKKPLLSTRAREVFLDYLEGKQYNGFRKSIFAEECQYGNKYEIRSSAS